MSTVFDRTAEEVAAALLDYTARLRCYNCGHQGQTISVPKGIPLYVWRQDHDLTCEECGCDTLQNRVPNRP